MSVVKKYQTGGTLPNQNEYSDFENFLSEKINKEASERTFTAKGEQALRAQAPLWMDNVKKGLFDKDEQGNLKHYNVDKFKNTYSINPGDNKDLNITDLQGNDGEIKPNLFGQLNLDKKKANTWIANARQEYEATRGKSTTTTTASPKTKVGFGPLESYMKEVVYNGNENWLSSWDDINKGLDERTVQRKIAEHAKGYMDWHNKKIANGDPGADYTEINGAQDFANATNKLLTSEFTPEDYTKFKELGSRYGTDFSSLWTPKTAEEVTAENAVKTQQQTEAYNKELLAKGLNPNLVKVILDNKMTLGELPEGTPNHVLNYITEQKAQVLNLPSGKQILLTSTGQILPNHDFNDPDNGYATYFTNDAEGFNYFAPGTQGYSGTNFTDPTGSTFALRPIKGTIQDFDGWNIFGVPKLVNGKKDYTKHLQLKDPNSGNVMDLYQQHDTPGLYADKDGKTYHSGDLTEFGEYTADIDINGNPVLSQSLNPNKFNAISKDYDKIQAVENPDVSLDLDENIDIGNSTIDKVKATLSGLRFIIDHPEKYSDFDTREAAVTKYRALTNKLDDPNLRNIKNQILENEDTPGAGMRAMAVSRPMGMYKKGGTLKLQVGGKARRLTPEEYAAVYKPTATTASTTATTAKTGMKDITGSVKDMNWLDGVSLAGSVASIFPVIGAAGAGVTTVADAIKDASDGDWSWGDTGNLAMNLGFTGLSLVGFGGVGTAAKAAKLAKGVETAVEVGKAANKARIAVEGIEDIAKLSKPLEEGLFKLAQGEAKTFKAAGITKTELTELKALHPDLAGVTRVTSVVPESFLSKISKVAEPIVEKAPIRNPNMLEREFSGTIKVAKAVAGMTNLSSIGKGVAMGAGALGVGAAGLSAVHAVGDFAQGGWDNVQVNDLKNSMFLASGIRGALKSRSVGNLAKKMNATEGEAKQLLQIGEGNPYHIDPNIKDPKVIEEAIDKLSVLKKLKERTRIRVGAAGNQKNIADNKESVKQYKEVLDKLTGKNIHEDVVATLLGKKVSVLGANKSAADLGVSQVEYDRARLMSEGKMNYWTPSWLKTEYKRKGGILKAGSGNKLSFDPGISKSYQYDKGYFDYVQGLDENWLTANRPALQKAVGNYQIENLQHLKYLGTDNMYGPVHKFLDFNYQNSDAGNAGGSTNGGGDNKVVDANPDSNASKTAQPVGKPNTVSTVDFSKPSGSLQLGSRGKFNFNVDKNDLYNLAGYLGANTATNKSILLQKRAALEGITRLPFANRQYFRQTSPNGAFFDKEGARTMGITGRMAGATSDLNRATNMMLTGADKANEYREKGNAMDQQQAYKTISDQMQSDRQTDMYNLQVSGKNQASSAEAAGAMFKYDAAGVVAKNQNFQNYLQQLNRSDGIKKQEAKYQNYYNLATSPESVNNYKEAETLTTDGQTARQAWEDNNAKLKVGTVDIQPWEKSQQGIDYTNRMKLLQDKRQDLQMRIYNASLAMQMPGSIGFRAKGGTMEEKKELIRYRHELASKDKDTENFYKVILKNNELMLKSLSRIFK